MSKIEWTLGTDPEVFLEQPSGSNYSAYDGFGTIINGTKHEPEPTEYGAIQIDGMAVEFNTNPTQSINHFSSLIQQGIDDVERRHPDKILSKKCLRHFSREFIDRQPKEATDMGCDPDFDAYRNGLANPSPDSNSLIRTAGGHLHIGWLKPEQFVNVDDGQHIRMCIEAAQQLDWAVGGWADKEDVAGAERKRLYGMLGSFRPKPYGIEYRYMSNFWIFNEEHRLTVAKRAIAGLQLLVDNYSFMRDLGPKVYLSYSKPKGIIIQQKLEPYMEKLDAIA